MRRLVLSMLLLVASCAFPVENAAAAEFRCRDGRVLQVHYSAKTATVLVEGRSYALVRKPSRLGARFASPTAALIVDGAFAAFAADDLYDLQGCQATSRPTKRPISALAA